MIQLVKKRFHKTEMFSRPVEEVLKSREIGDLEK